MFRLCFFIFCTALAFILIEYLSYLRGRTCFICCLSTWGMKIQGTLPFLKIILTYLCQWFLTSQPSQGWPGQQVLAACYNKPPSLETYMIFKFVLQCYMKHGLWQFCFLDNNCWNSFLVFFMKVWNKDR